MAFIGTPVIKQIADNKVRVTGLALGEHGSGTIGLHGAAGSAPDITLPASFKTEHYAYDGNNVPFQDSINVTINVTAIGSALIATTKTGTGTGDFRITFNDVSGEGPEFDAIIAFH